MTMVRRALRTAVVLLAWGAAGAAVRTRIDLAGTDERAVRPGNPVLRVAVRASDAAVDAGALEGALSEDLPKLAWMRLSRRDEPADLDLDVDLGAPEPAGPAIPFSARLVDRSGRTVWSVTGRTETDGAPIDSAALRSLGRNLVAALAHDGWLQYRDDPANPPPRPPVIRLGER